MDHTVGFPAAGMLGILLWTSAAEPADFPCPEPTMQVASGIAGDVQGQAQGLLRLATADLKGGVQKTVVNLWEKYPNADRIAVVQNLQSTSCNLLNSSTTLSDDQKIERWLTMLQMSSEYLKPK